ncbi:MAG: hypothetical protein ACFB0F_16560, partial [Neomegalonema sp.]
RHSVWIQARVGAAVAAPGRLRNPNYGVVWGRAAARMPRAGRLGDGLQGSEGAYGGCDANT